jgi:uncharacterized protein YhaN
VIATVTTATTRETFAEARRIEALKKQLSWKLSECRRAWGDLTRCSNKKDRLAAARRNSPMTDEDIRNALGGVDPRQQQIDKLDYAIGSLDGQLATLENEADVLLDKLGEPPLSRPI